MLPSEGVSHVEEVVVVCFEPVVGFCEQFFDGAAAMVAGNGVVQVPPDAFDRVRLRSVLRQEVELDTLPPLDEVSRTRRQS